METQLIAGIILGLNLLLFVPFFFLFVPKKVFRYNRQNLFKILSKYKLYIVVLGSVFILQSIEVNLVDRPTTTWLMQYIGEDGFAPFFYSIENGWVASMADYWCKPLLYYFVFFYLVVYSFVLWFIPVIFLLNDKEWHTRFVLLFYPMMWAIQLPFLLFFPVTNVYKYFGLQSTLEMIIPGVEASFYTVTSINNCFPSLHIGFAVSAVIIAFLSDNKRLKGFTPVFSLSVILATIYLVIHWLLDVLGGALLALLVGWLLWKKLNPQSITLSRVKPSRGEVSRLKTAVALLEDKAKNEVKGKGIEVQLVGSVAKDTYLKDSIDIDLFLLFPPSTDWNELEAEGLSIGKRVLEKWELKYAEHPYIHGDFGGYEVDVVPCYKVGSAKNILSAVDRTPFHTQYINAALKRRQRNQVRLLKQFLKGIGIYGAGAEADGFSGYLCELLILRYGSFKKVLDHAPKWSKEGLTLTEGSPSKFDSSLVFIDPVDPNRNVAAAVTGRSLEIFEKASDAYLEDPSIRFFFPLEPKPLNVEEIRSRLGREERLIGFEVKVPVISSEILLPQIKKAERNARSLLEENGFNCKHALHTLAGSKTLFLFELESVVLSEPLLHRGPLAKDEENSKKFTERWTKNKRTIKGPYVEGKRWVVEIEREFSNAYDLLNKKLMKINLGKNIKPQIKEGYDLLRQEDLFKEPYRRFVGKLIEAKYPWEYK